MLSNFEGGIMCEKLKELSGYGPEEILNKYWNKERNVYPIDISKILYNMKIRVSAYDFSKFDNGNLEDRILGAMVAKGKDLALLYRKGETKNRSRFTLAHELAHCCLAHYQFNNCDMPYIEYRHDGVLTDQYEEEANIFAGELLIPDKELRMVLESEYPDTFPEIVKLSKLFAVSWNVMKGRLRYLKIPYIDEHGHKILILE